MLNFAQKSVSVASSQSNSALNASAANTMFMLFWMNRDVLVQFFSDVCFLYKYLMSSIAYPLLTNIQARIKLD
jgi:hypothetical protein